MVSLAILLVGLAGQGQTPPLPTDKPPTPKVESIDIKEGTGETVEFGDIVSVDYTGKLMSGKVFDTSKKPGGKPFSLVVGIGEVIKGWDQGLIGMKAGGIRKLKIPPELAYGERGTDGIPGNATLTFTVAVNKVNHAQKRMKVEITKAGSGPEVKLFDVLMLHMSCKSLDGKAIFNTPDTPEGTPFSPGVPPAPIPGFTLGVLGMKVGEKRTVTIPPELAFGTVGQPKLGVKPNAIIVFDIELLSIGSASDKSGGVDKRQ